MKIDLRICTTLAVLAALSGCGLLSNTCEPGLAPAEITTIAELRTPSGITEPDTSNALRIPSIDTPEPPPPVLGACLESPPVYTAGWQPAEDSRIKKKERRWWWPFGRR